MTTGARTTPSHALPQRGEYDEETGLPAVGEFPRDTTEAMRRMGAADRMHTELAATRELLEKLNREPQQRGRHPEITFQIRRIDTLLNEVKG